MKSIPRGLGRHHENNTKSYSDRDEVLNQCHYDYPIQEVSMNTMDAFKTTA